MLFFFLLILCDNIRVRMLRNTKESNILFLDIFLDCNFFPQFPIFLTLTEQNVFTNKDFKCLYVTETILHTKFILSIRMLMKKKSGKVNVKYFLYDSRSWKNVIVQMNIQTWLQSRVQIMPSFFFPSFLHKTFSFQKRDVNNCIKYIVAIYLEICFGTVQKAFLVLFYFHTLFRVTIDL